MSMLSAVIDIGSGSVGLALVLLKRGVVPILKYSARQELRIQKTLNPKRLLRQSLGALTVVIGEMQKRGPDIPSKIFCFLSSHLVASQTRVTNLKFNEPTVVSENIVHGIVERELQNLKTEYSRLKDGSDVVIEQKIMKIKLNGYEISSFKNKTAKEVEISSFFTLISNDTLNKIRRLILDSFHNQQTEFHSFSFAHFSFLRDLFKLEQNFIFMDIGSEITDISLVDNGVLEKSASFPLGKNEVIRIMIDKTNSDQALVESMIKNYTEKVVEIKTNQSHNISSAGGKWLRAVRLILDEFSLKEKLPRKMFILADPSISGLFKKFITSLHLANLTFLNQEPTVRELTSTDFNKFYKNESGSASDPFLTVSTIFVNKLLS